MCTYARMLVCMCVCTYACMYICVYVFMHVCMYVHICVCIRIFTSLWKYFVYVWLQYLIVWIWLAEELALDRVTSVCRHNLPRFLINSQCPQSKRVPRATEIKALYLLIAIGLTPCGSSTVHIYTQTIHRTTQVIWEKCGPFSVFALSLSVDNAAPINGRIVLQRGGDNGKLQPYSPASFNIN